MRRVISAFLLAIAGLIVLKNEVLKKVVMMAIGVCVWWIKRASQEEVLDEVEEPAYVKGLLGSFCYMQ